MRRHNRSDFDMKFIELWLNFWFDLIFCKLFLIDNLLGHIMIKWLIIGLNIYAFIKFVQKISIKLINKIA